jgi:hypothetical protein
MSPDDTLSERIESLGKDVATFATRLEPSHSISQIFKEAPSKDLVHILVQRPLSGA